MKAQYGILRFKKYKGPAISPIEAHNERTKEQYASNPDTACAAVHNENINPNNIPNLKTLFIFYLIKCIVV